MIGSRLKPALAVVLGLALLLAWRCWQVLHSGAGLHVDEAQYWYWSSRPLEWGYFSKPPLLVGLIRLSTDLFGHGLLGVKALAMVAWLLASAVLWRLGAAMGSERAGLIAAALLAATPASGLLGLSATTDSVLMLFWSLVMWGSWRAAHAEGAVAWRWWALTGLALGLGLLSKYTAGALSLSALWLLWRCPPARRGQLLAGLALAAGIAILLLLPHLFWNMHNGWPTLHHTLDITVQGGAASAADRAAGWGHKLGSAAEFGLGQLLLLGPAGLAVLALAWKRRHQPVVQPATTATPALWSALDYAWTFAWPLLALGLLQALRAKAQVNWALPALLGICLAAGWLAVRSKISGKVLATWVLAGLLLSAAIAQGGDLRRWIGRPAAAGKPAWDIWSRMRGWHEALGALAPALAPHRDLPWVTSDRTLLVQIGYELRALQPELRSWSPGGQVRHHFDWKQPLRPEAAPAALVFLGDEAPDAALLALYPLVRPLAEAESGRVKLQAWLLERPGTALATLTPTGQHP
ncbi:ArnT family glycosyltransferase [Malikia spinosa]|uniref:ArnT family glycosyltransferase n=1 Tax=Malikia spinosa TaxID=86180 RepID=UPI0027BB0F3C|nr:glycosyltransferase family 39 protein [Malikia spinosa]